MWGDGSLVGAATWGVDGGSPVGGSGQSRLSGNLVEQRPEGCSRP
jgi:hypothetical protein